MRSEIIRTAAKFAVFGAICLALTLWLAFVVGNRVFNDPLARDTFGLHGGGSTHAWVQVFLPGIGWADFDPTNAIVGNHGLIRVAVAREPDQAVPLWGSYVGFPAHDLGMEVTVSASREGDEAREQSPARGFG